MGRQAYITRLALGRSAFESTSVAQEDGGTDTRRDDGQEQPPTQRRRREASSRPRQIYDSRGHPINPESRMISRRSRRAQNDVLSTVGVCVATKYSTTSGDEEAEQRAYYRDRRQELKSVKSENELGLILKTMDLGILFLATWWILGLRYRLEVFPHLSKLSFKELLRFQIREEGLPSLLLAGLPAQALFMILDVGKDFALSTFHQWAFMSFLWDEESRKRRKSKYNYLMFVEEVFSETFFILVSPLQIFKTQQLLGLVSAKTPFPGFRSMIPFSATSPIQVPFSKDQLSLKGVPTVFKSILRSPFVLLWVYWNLRGSLSTTLYDSIRFSLPRPGRPDRISIRAARDDYLFGDVIPGIEPGYPPRSTQRMRGDTSAAFQEVRDALGSFFSRPISDRLSEFASRIFYKLNGADEASTLSIYDGDESPHNVPIVSDSRELERETALGRTQAVIEDSEDHHRILDLAPSSPSDTATISHSSSGDENSDDGESDRRPPGIQLSNRRINGGDTVTMEVEIPAIPIGMALRHVDREDMPAHLTGTSNQDANVGPSAETDEVLPAQEEPNRPAERPFLALPSPAQGQHNNHRHHHHLHPTPHSDTSSSSSSSSSSASSRSSSSSRLQERSARRKTRRHRLTTLSSLPVDSLALHASTFLTHILIIPLEAVFLRGIAAAAIAANPSMTRRVGEPGLASARVALTQPNLLPGLAVSAGLELALSFTLHQVGYLGVLGWGWW
ncbi:MAG: hypothetical protein M4579_004278, partial [Chaenotheca gracillima]